jgi:hypothetical protein
MRGIPLVPVTEPTPERNFFGSEEVGGQRLYQRRTGFKAGTTPGDLPDGEAVLWADPVTHGVSLGDAEVQIPMRATMGEKVSATTRQTSLIDFHRPDRNRIR